MHGLRSALALAGLVALVSIGAMVRTQVARRQEATRIEGLVGRLVSAEPNQFPDIVKELDANPEVAATFLSPLLADRCHDTRREAGATACSPGDGFPRPVAGRATAEELLTGKVAYVAPIRQQLRPYAR